MGVTMFHRDESASERHHLPPRNWRQWWRQLPGYWRIAAWSAAALVVLHVALAIRTVIVYQEAEQIVELRRRGVDIHYHWERILWEPTGRWKSEWEKKLYEGFLGRSCRNVAAAGIDLRGNQDELLREVCGLFPNLECIIVRDAELSEHGLTALSKCPRLKWIGLTGCNTTDRDVELLTKHKAWIGVWLQGTLITDASIPSFQQLGSLRFLNISNTAISSSKIAAWQSSPAAAKVTLFSNANDDTFDIRVSWPDGRRDSEFHMPFTLVAEGPFLADASPESRAASSRQIIAQQQFLERTLQSGGDGEYRLSLSYGEHAAEPVAVRVQDGKLPPRRVEFRMPVTKAEALKSVK